jgi:hypothetical protein
MRTFVSFVVAVLAVGCATGIQSESETDPIIDGGSGGGGGIGGSGSGAATTTTTTSGGGDGGSGGSVNDCMVPRHVCGGLCVDNTPGTGCYQSTSCTACPTPTNGSATCATDGLCDVMCTSPYVKSGTSCNCPTQCCSNTECSGNATCDNGSCVSPCDQAACLITCALQNKAGLCLNNICVCS